MRLASVEPGQRQVVTRGVTAPLALFLPMERLSGRHARALAIKPARLTGKETL